MSKTSYIVSEGKPEDLTSYQSIDTKDEVLIESFDLDTTLNQSTDNVELHIYSLDQRLLSSDEEFKGYTVLKGGSKRGEVISDITLNPELDAQNAGFDKGDVNLLYNFTSNLYSDLGFRPRFYINEISPDRKELKLLSNEVSSEEILRFTNELRERLNSTSYFEDFRLNFGKNSFAIGVNVRSEVYEDTQAVVVKLYEPLQTNFGIKDLLRIEELKGDSVLFTVTSLQEPVKPATKKLRQANFNLEESEDFSLPSSFLSYSDLIGYPISGSNYQIYSEANKKGINLNLDYTDYSSFINFSSAEERLRNFRYKLQLLESYETSLNLVSTGSLQASGSYNDLIKGVINNFDHYENYLYYESSSFAWPKTSSTKPYSLYHTTSSAAINWYSSVLQSASIYDATNIDRLSNTIPEYISDDSNNEPYLLFVDMIGQHFDNLWIYAKDITEKYDADNRLDFGISKDLVRYAVQNFGINLYENNESLDNLFDYFIGQQYISGSGVNTFSVEKVSKDNYLKEVYKRIYHNLPYLLKSKGTFRGLRALINSFGIPSNVLDIKMYGGVSVDQRPYFAQATFLTSSLDEIRTDNTGSNLSENTLSYYTSILKNSSSYTSDLNRVDVGFNINDSINQYFRDNITGSFNIDEYLGDPGYAYSSSYESLDRELDTLLVSGSTYLAPFGVTDFVNFISFYNNTIFRMVRDFVPAKANVNTGIIVESSILDRSKAKQVEVEWQYNDYSGSLEVAHITGSSGDSFGSKYTNGKIVDHYSSSYTDTILLPSGGVVTIDELHGFEQPKYNGEFSGSFLTLYDGDLTSENTFKKQKLKEFTFKYRPVLGFQTFPFLVVTGSATTASACLGVQSTTLYGKDPYFPINDKLFTDLDGSNVYIDGSGNNYVSNKIHALQLFSGSGEKLNAEVLDCNPNLYVFNLIRNSNLLTACDKVGTEVEAIGFNPILTSNTEFYFSASGLLIDGAGDYFVSSSISDSTYVRLNGGSVVDQGTCPAASPSPTPTISVTPSITPSNTPPVSPSSTPASSPGVTSTPTPSITVSPSRTPSISVSPTVTPSATSTPIAPSVTPSRTPSASVTPSRTPSASVTPSITPSPSATPVSPSASPSPTPSITVSPSVTPSISPSNFLQAIRIYVGTDVTDACTTSTFEDLYILGGDPDAGEIFYEDSGGSTPWSNIVYTHFREAGTNNVYNLEVAGGNLREVGTEAGTCPSPSPTPSVTPTVTPSTTPPLTEYKSNRLDLSGVADSTTSCGIATAAISIYIAESSLGAVEVGNVFYSDSGGTAAWDGDDLWYGLNTSSGVSPSYSFQINSSGQVTDVATCPAPSPTPSVTPTISVTPSITPTPTLTPTPTPSNTPLFQSTQTAGNGSSTPNRTDECSAFTSVDIYSNDATTVAGLGIGDTMYTSSDTSFGNRWIGGDLWYGLSDSAGLADRIAQIDNNGVIQDIEDCP